MREITMRLTGSLVRAALSASLLSTLPLVLGVSALLAECSLAIAGENVLKGFRPVTDDMLQKPDPGDWLMRRGDYRAWGYSALDQIRVGNVGALKLAWAWNMEPGYQEEAPLVHDGVIFLANPQNVVQALDGRTGDLLWEYRRELPKIEGGYHNDLFDRARGTIALYGDKVFLASANCMSWRSMREQARSCGTQRWPTIAGATRSPAVPWSPRAR
jgi:alcohol dehydrogenase (cytochrome c)